jgi:group I intron endonuclease
MPAGIYRIVVDRGEKPPRYYIGQAADLQRRKGEHLSNLRCRRHKNMLLQRAYLKYGAGSFSFEIMLVCEKKKAILSMYEQWVLDSYAETDVYNIQRECVDSHLGCVMPLETRAKIGVANSGKTASVETRALQALAKIGVKQSAETLAKRAETKKANSLARGGRSASPEGYARILESLHRRKGITKRGAKKTAEENERRIATRRANAEARGYWAPPEAVAKQVAKNTGRKHTPEHCAKIGAAGIGRKATAEARVNMSAAQKGRTISAEARMKTSKTLTGVKHTPERCAAKSKSMQGRRVSEVAKKKISLANTGKKRTPEQCARISDGIIKSRLNKSKVI